MMRRTLFASAAVALVVAACGGSTTTTTAAPAATTTTTAATTTSTTTGTSTSIDTTTGALGTYLVDGNGNTLYVFLNDKQGPSTCYDACEANWPPLMGTVTAGNGVDGALLGSAARKDGSMQVTYNGWPLYYFANDLKPGETNGQGVKNVWYVVSPKGDPIK